MNIKTNKRIMNMEHDIINSFIKLRKEVGMSQEMLASKNNISRVTIARIETFINSPQLNTMLKLLVSLGYTLEIVPIKNKKN